jgi:hypothetical protein
MAFMKTESFYDSDPTLMIHDVPSIGWIFFDRSYSYINAPSVVAGDIVSSPAGRSADVVLQLLLDVSTAPRVSISSWAIMESHWDVDQYQIDISESCTWSGRTPIRVFHKLRYRVLSKLSLLLSRLSTCCVWTSIHVYVKPSRVW